ncbi:hypothetical protein INT46_003358 [Mucor plumbeus]|uniref:F-box domain-containing protein n=1 Tax=Mucor plumbeus TaxID=97098 RepID=A0A8H7USQ5_9FUNG|nr:hypothetical protein INT46_003358 [Mucor plumbeus]
MNSSITTSATGMLVAFMANRTADNMNGRLPPDVLLDIFKNLNQADLINCKIVCRNWLEPARNREFRRIELQTDEDLRLLAGFVENNPANSIRIREITVSVLNRYSLFLAFAGCRATARIQLSILFRCCSNLEYVYNNPADQYEQILLEQSDITSDYMRRFPNLRELVLLNTGNQEYSIFTVLNNLVVNQNRVYPHLEALVISMEMNRYTLFQLQEMFSKLINLQNLKIDLNCFNINRRFLQGIQGLDVFIKSLHTVNLSFSISQFSFYPNGTTFGFLNRFVYTKAPANKAVWSSKISIKFDPKIPNPTTMRCIKNTGSFIHDVQFVLPMNISSGQAKSFFQTYGRFVDVVEHFWILPLGIRIADTEALMAISLQRCTEKAVTLIINDSNIIGFKENIINLQVSEVSYNNFDYENFSGNFGSQITENFPSIRKLLIQITNRQPFVQFLMPNIELEEFWLEIPILRTDENGAVVPGLINASFAIGLVTFNATYTLKDNGKIIEGDQTGGVVLDQTNIVLSFDNLTRLIFQSGQFSTIIWPIVL